MESDTKMNSNKKFQILALNQKIMVWMGIHSYRLTEPTNEFFYSFISYYNLLAAYGFLFASSAVVVYENWPNLDIILQPFSIVMAGYQVGGMFLSTGLKMKTVKLLQLKLQQTVDEGIIICHSIFFLKINFDKYISLTRN